MKILVIYYSAFGYVTIMANEVAEGARSAGASVDIKRVPETCPPLRPRRYISSPTRERLSPGNRRGPGELRRHHRRQPVRGTGAPPRRWRVPGSGRRFLYGGALRGKVGGAFTSPSTQYGGQEITLISILANLLHFGMVVVGPPFSAATMADSADKDIPAPKIWRAPVNMAGQSH